jgi:hypothetical protein
MIVKPISDIKFFIEKFGQADARSGYVVRWHEKQKQDTFFSPHTFIGNFNNCTVHSTPPLLITEEKQMITDHVWPLLWKVKHKPQKTHSLWQSWGDNIDINLPAVSKHFTETETYVWMPIDEESCNNPWHVWIDVIAKWRLLWLQKKKPFTDYVYIFPCMGKYLERVLKEVYPEIKYYMMPKKSAWHFKDILVPSMVNCNDGETQPASIEWLRDQKYRVAQISRPSKKIFITRSDALTRQLTNQDELLLALSGFEPIELSNCSIKEQMEIFDSATHIVSTHGAGLVNLLWSQYGTKVIEINHIEQIDKKVYPVLSHHCGHKHTVLYGEKIQLPYKNKPKGIKRKNDMAHIKINIKKVLESL